jgi:Flp pilus assembly protein TadD
MKARRLVALAAIITALATYDASAGDVLKITIPRHSELTPVQRLNREGVDAVKKQQYERAATLFYKAYLYDPGDPFTLNNLGYISELQGELDRARKFYTLASEQGSNANIDRSNTKHLEGKSMRSALSNLDDTPMLVNQMNVDAMELLSEHRDSEAVSLLLKALSVDPSNPFTRNNLGVANEAAGDYDAALNYYGAVAASNSSEAVVVTLDHTWRGRPVKDMAAESAARLEQRMKKMGTVQANVVRLTIRGVSATNHNNWPIAREDFLKAYSLDPSDAFSLNNRGYVAERDGDMETAEYFYGKARRADNSNNRVGLSTQQSEEGKKLSSLATDSGRQVNGELDKYREYRRRQTGPIELTPRDNRPSGDSSVVPSKLPSPSNPGSDATVATPQPQ